MNSSAYAYLENLEKKYTEILEDDPASECFVPLAEVLIKRKKADDALKVLISGLRHNKHNIKARFMLGNIYFDRWKIDNAKKEFEKVIKLAPDNIAVSKILIQIYSSEENFDGALQIARNLSFCYPGNKEVKAIFSQLSKDISIRETGKSADENKDETDRRFVYLNETSGDEYEGTATETLANLYFEQGHHAQSIKILNILLKQNPFNIKLLKKIEKIKNAEMNLNTTY